MPAPEVVQRVPASEQSGAKAPRGLRRFEAYGQLYIPSSRGVPPGPDILAGDPRTLHRFSRVAYVKQPEGEGVNDYVKRYKNERALQAFGKSWNRLSPKQQWNLERQIETEATEEVERELHKRRGTQVDDDGGDWNDFIGTKPHLTAEQKPFTLAEENRKKTARKKGKK